MIEARVASGPLQRARAGFCIAAVLAAATAWAQPVPNAPTSAATAAPAAAPAAASAPATTGVASTAPESQAAVAARPATRAAGDVAERLQVADPFIELRTGPGRGYPVTYVVERRGWIVVELRRTDWYRVRAEALNAEHVGWVHRSQLETTLTEAGGSKTFRDLVVDDYLKRRVEFGAAWGRLRAEPMLKLFTGVRLGDTLGVELTMGQVQGAFSGTEFWHLSVVSEPWSHQRLSPFASVGFGRFRNIPNTSLVDAKPVSTNLGHAGLGLRWYLSERLVARLDWSLYTAFVADERTLEYRAATVGVSFFF